MRSVLLAAMLCAALPVAAQAAGDAASGEKIFNKCKSCHMVGENAKSRVGPSLNGVVGRAWGAYEGYKYSNALMDGAKEGKVWDEATLDAYLEKPKAIIPKGKMSFAGLKKADDRADIIAYLAQFNADGSMK